MQQGTGRFRRLGAAVLTALTATAGLAAMATTAEAVPSFTFTRLGGNDRYATAAIIATSSFPGGATTVVVATGDNFPDALAGNYIAGQRNAPVLLTQQAAVPASTLAALQTLRAKNVVLLGGLTAVSQAVENTLNATPSANAAGGNISVVRLAGPTRYDTMREVALNPGAAAVGTIGGRRTAIIATGENFADAVSLGPVSWANKLPIILTQPDTLLPQASSTLTALGIQQVLIAGGPVAISSAVESAINAMGVTTLQRFAGADRSETSRLAADYAINSLGFKNSHFNLASGDPALGGADALAGGSHGGAEDPTVILLTRTASDPGAAVAFAAARAATLTSGHAFGLELALSPSLLDAVTNAARGIAPGGFNVTPGGNLVRTNSSVGQGTPTDQQGDTTLTFGGLSGTVDVVLIPCDAYRPSINRFANSNDNNIADRTGLAGFPAIDQATTSAQISSVNGSSAGVVLPAANYANNVATSGGNLTVVVTNLFDLNPGADVPCVRVLVFNDANNNNALNVNTDGTATEVFSVSGRLQFFPELAQSGQFSAVADVQAVDKTVNRFGKCVITINNTAPTLDVVDTGQCTSMNFDANDDFFVDRGVGPFFPVTFAEFQRRISPGDDVFGTYAADPGAPSEFRLLDEAPNPPLNVVANVGATGITLSFADSTTPTADAYNIYRQIDPTPADGCAVPPVNDLHPLPDTGYSLVGTVLDETGFATGDPVYSFVDAGLTDGTRYCYIIRTVDEGDESINSGPIAFGIPGIGAGGGAAGAPFFISSFAQDNGTAGILDGTTAFVPTPDIITLVANEPLAMSVENPNTLLRLQDADGTRVDLVNGTNAIFDLNDQTPVTIGGVVYPINQVLRVTVTATPSGAQLLSGGTVPGLQYPATIVNVNANVQDADQGNTLILTSGDNIIEGNIQDAVPGGPQMSGPPVGTITAVGATFVVITFNEQVRCGGINPGQFVSSTGGPATSLVCIGDRVVLSGFGPGFDPSANQTITFTQSGIPAERVTDLQGNAAPSGQVSQLFTPTAVGNAAPPTIAVTSGPANGGTTADNTPTFGGSASDTFGGVVTGIAASVDGGGFAPITCFGCPGANVTFTFTPAALADGAHTITFRATDNQGATASVTRTFTIDTTAPTITRVVAVPGFNVLRVTFSEPVNCQAGSEVGFGYDDQSFFNDSDDPTLNGIFTVNANTCNLGGNFGPGGLKADDFGQLTYNPLLVPVANRIRQAAFPNLELGASLAPVVDDIRPGLQGPVTTGNFSIQPAAAANNVEVRFDGAIRNDGETANLDDNGGDGILCSSIGLNDIVLLRNGTAVPVIITCTGTADRFIDIQLLAGTFVAGETVRVQVANGAITDQSGNLSVASFVENTVP